MTVQAGREQKGDQAEDAKEPHAKSAHAGGFRAGGIPQRAHLDECPGLYRTDHAPHFARSAAGAGGPNVNDQWSELGGDMRTLRKCRVVQGLGVSVTDPYLLSATIPTISEKASPEPDPLEAPALRGNARARTPR